MHASGNPKSVQPDQRVGLNPSVWISFLPRSIPVPLAFIEIGSKTSPVWQKSTPILSFGNPGSPLFPEEKNPALSSALKAGYLPSLR
jgi:hypothetical protein